nr:hypothetical protein [uncultured Undibacterium sp.]
MICSFSSAAEQAGLTATPIFGELNSARIGTACDHSRLLASIADVLTSLQLHPHT